MKKLNTKGFGLIEGLLILVIVGIVGGTGFYVYNANKKASSGSDGTTIAKRDKNDTEDGKPVNTSDENYLLIEEWGIKIPQLPEGNVISYEIDENNNFAFFVSSEQKAVGGDCGEFSFARYAIQKTNIGYKPADEIEKFKLDEAKKNDLDIEIDGSIYYILGDFSGGDCAGKAKEGEDMSSQEVKANNNLLDLLKGLVKAD